MCLGTWEAPIKDGTSGQFSRHLPNYPITRLVSPFSMVAPIGPAIGLDVLAVPAQVSFFSFQLFAVVPELGLVRLDLRLDGVVCSISGQLLLVLLDQLFLL